MLCNLVRKEILANLLSLRFTLALLLTISLFSVSGFVFVARYRQQSQDYWSQTNENLSKLSDSASQLYKLAFGQQKFWRRPKPLTLCAEGSERYLPNVIRSDLFGTSLPATGGRGNFLLRRFHDVDWVFIISIPLSFVALLFTYDSFCGEKESGTLRLILSGSVPRYRILAGKYLGAVGAFILPLLAGLLINLIIVVSSRAVDLRPADWLRFLGIFLISISYLSVFLLLGMFVSSRVSHSISSIVILLLIWAGLVVLLPSFGSVVAETTVVLPPADGFRRRILETMKRIDEEAAAGKYGKNVDEVWNGDPNYPVANLPGVARYREDWATSVSSLWEGRHNQMLAQAYAGRDFACLSPAVIYQRASEAIAGTGIHRCVDLCRQVKRYHDDLRQFILDQDAGDPNSLHMLIDLDFAAEKWGTLSKKPVDFSTVPKFEERDYGFSESLQLAGWDIGVLLLLNLLFFAASFVSFVRYDVR